MYLHSLWKVGTPKNILRGGVFFVYVALELPSTQCIECWVKTLATKRTLRYNTLMILFWSVVFVVALGVLVKGADWLLDSAEHLGIRFGFSPFVIGVLLTGVGTSLPELASGIAGVLQGAPEIVVANAVGSNIANIFLVMGIAAIVGRRLIVTRNLIDLELPLLAISTGLFILVISDGTVSQIEALFLVATYIVYLMYSVFTNEDTSTVISQRERAVEARLSEYKERLSYYFMKPILIFRDYLMFALGVVAIFIGAKFTIDAVVKLSELLNIGTAVISISAIAIGTSLPELIVSVKSVLRKKYEVAIGNILGSNAFNLLMVVGIPGAAVSLPLNDVTLNLAVPVMALATFLFIISGISKTLYHWEGMMFLIVYAFFILKLFGTI